MSDPIGLFQACYRVSRDNSGGATAIFKWLVNPVTQTITGVGSLTQAINPPTDIRVEMNGTFARTEDGAIVVHASGAVFGASIQVVLKLKAWGGNGEALHLHWLANNHYFSDSDVPAHSIDCNS